MKEPSVRPEKFIKASMVLVLMIVVFVGLSKILVNLGSVSQYDEVCKKMYSIDKDISRCVWSTENPQ